jgi:citrate lyase subunit beta / citryl-CoA lyase
MTPHPPHPPRPPHPHHPPRPRRSVLYVPGINARALEKAKSLPCDAVILDLEDAVAPEAKTAARAQVVAAVAAGAGAGGFGVREVIMRINGLDSPWWLDDLGAAAKARPHAILVPKVAKPADLLTVASRLIDIAADHDIRVWAMIETLVGVINAPAIAATGHDVETRLAGFVMGTNDLARESRARQLPGRAPMLPWLANAVLAARAFGIDILDGVYNDISDAEGFRRECVQGRDMGFDGKTLIHPSQIAPCNAAFSPSEAEVAQARKIIAAFELPENHGKGVVQIDGTMVERLHADMARRTLAIAQAITEAAAEAPATPAPAASP